MSDRQRSWGVGCTGGQRTRTLANDCESASLWPSSRNLVTAAPSRTKSPDAKPWYALSKIGKSSFSFMRALSSAHCSADGSTPVGLCAHACSRKKEPLGAAWTSSIMPAKSRPRVAGS